MSVCLHQSILSDNVLSLLGETRTENGRYAEVVSFFSDKRNKQVIVSIDFAEEGDINKNFKYEQYMNGYNGGYCNIIVSAYEHDNLTLYPAKKRICL